MISQKYSYGNAFTALNEKLKNIYFECELSVLIFLQRNKRTHISCWRSSDIMWMITNLSTQHFLKYFLQMFSLNSLTFQEISLWTTAASLTRWTLFPVKVMDGFSYTFIQPKQTCHHLIETLKVWAPLFLHHWLNKNPSIHLSLSQALKHLTVICLGQGHFKSLGITSNSLCAQHAIRYTERKNRKRF